MICSKHGCSSAQGWVESGKEIAVFNFKLTVTLKYVANEFAAFLGTNEQVKVTFAFIILYLVFNPSEVLSIPHVVTGACVKLHT